MHNISQVTFQDWKDKFMVGGKQALAGRGDTAKIHTKEVIKKRRDTEICFCPELGAIEECWHQSRIRPFMYEHHEHVSGCARAAMKYLRTAAFSQNIEQYLFRKPIAKTF